MIIYEAFNEPILEYIPTQVTRILDLGCGNGILGKKIKETHTCEITGVTYSEDEAKIARQHINQVKVADLNTIDTSEIGKFDCIICSHVLEHLYQPEELLKKLYSNLSDNGVLIVALPNIMFYRQRWQLMKGNFKYTEGGLMDSTHFRFFDWDTAQKLITESGFKLTSSRSYGNVPLPILRKIIPSFAHKIDNWALNKKPGLFGWQFIFTAIKS
jgi:cyclopropane fatty-acyl-phospholipid synthase-like methyltransferase